MTSDMSDILDLHLKHFVKVKVTKIDMEDGSKRSAYEYFSIDPRTANYNKLRKQLAHLFRIDGEFLLSFKKDKAYVPLISDWDLDGAIAEYSKPCLSLAIEAQPLDQTLEEWDIISPADIPPVEPESTRCAEDRKSLAGSIISQVENAMMRVQRVLSIEISRDALQGPVVDEATYKSMLDREGRIANHWDLHRAVFEGGVDPYIRSTVWKHLLNIFPHGMTMQERKDYMSAKCEEYYQLRYRWQHLRNTGTVPDVLRALTSAIMKDVMRTDRTEKFYSGPEQSEGVKGLFNILTTYAVNHPDVSYCQGMGDLLSPILYVMKKEAEAYVCFCGLMKRARTNFKFDGKSLGMKTYHLKKMLCFYDHELYMHLKKVDVLDLVFCYRWLFLDLKREFPYREMLSLMEVIWASLPPKPPLQEIELYEVKFPTADIMNSLKDKTTLKDRLTMKEDHFGETNDDISISQSVTNNTTAEKIKRWALRIRRESIAKCFSFSESYNEEEIKLPIHYRKRKYRSYITGKLGRLNKQSHPSDAIIRSCKVPSRKDSLLPICQSWSCGEEFGDKPQFTDALYDAREFLRGQWCYSNTVNEIQLNNWLNGRGQLDVTKCAISSKDDDSVINESNSRERHSSSDSNYSALSEDFDGEVPDNSTPRSRRSQSEGYMSDMDSKETTVNEEDEDDQVYDSEDEVSYTCSDSEFVDSMADRKYEDSRYFDRKKEMLPPPDVLGDGNPFVLFLCISMIKSHRNEILEQNLDINGVGIYFDKLVRKHKLSKILHKAKSMFQDYLNMGWNIDCKDDVSDG